MNHFKNKFTLAIRHIVFALLASFVLTACLGGGGGGESASTSASSTPANAKPMVAAGYRFSLALKSDGTVAAWGGNSYGESTVPSGLSNVIAVAAGSTHSLALKSDGTVAAWGDNSYGQSTVPSGLSNVVAVADGGAHSLALKSDGTVVAWGDNSYGVITVPSGLSNVVAVATGTTHSLALMSDGTVMAWGDNSYGQSTVPSGLSNVVAVAVGTFHSLALKSDGTVVTWGYNDFVQVPSGLSNVVAVAAGESHSLALKSDGTVVAWGGNSYGQSTVPSGLFNVVAVVGGIWHSLALKSDGTVVAWGDNSYGQSTVPAGLNLGVGTGTPTPATPTAPTISTATPPSGTVGAAYSFTYAATGSTPITYSVTSGAMPNGLSLSASGVISGTPTQAGVFTGIVTASNGTAPNAMQNFSITVTSTSTAPTISTATPQGGTVGTAYSFTYTVTGSTPITFSVTSGVLPNGLSLSASGVISGTPSQAGVFTGIVTASNGTAPDAMQSFSIAVTSTPMPPTPTVATGVTFSGTLGGFNSVANTSISNGVFVAGGDTFVTGSSYGWSDVSGAVAVLVYEPVNNMILVNLGSGSYGTQCGVSSTVSISVHTYPVCSSVGITFNRASGMITFASTPLHVGGRDSFFPLSGITATGSLSFAPF